MSAFLSTVYVQALTIVNPPLGSRLDVVAAQAKRTISLLSSLMGIFFVPLEILPRLVNFYKINLSGRRHSQSWASHVSDQALLAVCCMSALLTCCSSTLVKSEGVSRLNHVPTYASQFMNTEILEKQGRDLLRLYTKLCDRRNYFNFLVVEKIN